MPSTMDISSTISILIMFSSSVYCKPDCEKVVCPTLLECKFPKVKVELPDLNNKECCNITECICEGTNSRLSASHDLNEHYRTLVTRFTNCTMIDGNLEIVYIQPQKRNSIFDVTKHIKEVTGYVLIAMNSVRYIDLSSLRLIRGENLFAENLTPAQVCGYTGPVSDAIQYALSITRNQKADDKTRALRGVYMPRLTEIRKGHVKVEKNNHLCFVDSIIWEGEILNTLDQTAVVKMGASGVVSATCGACPPSCVTDKVDSNPHCWGASTELCQSFTRMPCKHYCSQRCSAEPFKNGGPGRCCERYCAAGCTASGDCHACINFNNFGKCERRCPTGVELSAPYEFPFTVDRDNIRYELFRFCVKECPITRKVLEAERKCVLTCPLHYYEENGLCKQCPLGGCSNICYGLEAELGPLKFDDVIHSGNMGNFSKNCTIIEGSLRFTEVSFDGDSYCGIGPISKWSAYDVFENVEEITGFLSIEDWPYKDLSVFRNLKRIRGRRLDKRENAYSLLIMTHQRNLKELCLNSLEEIERGLVAVDSNRDLCHVDSVNWNIMFKQPEQYVKNGANAKTKECLSCNENCDAKDGCWGSGSEKCVTCLNYTDYTDSSGNFAGQWVKDPASGRAVPGHNVTSCVQSCDTAKGVYATRDNKCFPCDAQCNQTCTGPGAMSCTSSVPGRHGCKNILHDGECVETCPISHFPNADLECQPCTSYRANRGCAGIICFVFNLLHPGPCD